MTDKIKTEAELCKALEAHFCDYEVYKEVPTSSGRCDMYVKKGCLWIAVEAKMQFTPTLIYQAYRNIAHSNFSYVAIPHLKDTYHGQEICKMLGIGVLKYEHQYGSYDQTGPMRWKERVAPAFRRKIAPLRVLEEMKLAEAGVQHNGMSEYKITLSNIRQFLENKGGRYPIKELFEITYYHYSSSRSAHQCITKLCRTGAIKEFKIDGKDFVLTDPSKIKGNKLFKS